MNPPDYRDIYNQFDMPVVDFDCGELCAPYNPSSKPFCCDICYAIPFAYHTEWDYLKDNTNLWHIWSGDECPGSSADSAVLMRDIPDTRVLVACLGPDQCQRSFRSISCRRFPFFPYISSENVFIGLATNWYFEDTCWVLSHLDQVDNNFRNQFVQFYDDFLTKFPEESRTYEARSSKMRSNFTEQKRSLTILHRDGGTYLLRPINERLRQVSPDRLPRFGVYR